MVASARVVSGVIESIGRLMQPRFPARFQICQKAILGHADMPFFASLLRLKSVSKIECGTMICTNSEGAHEAFHERLRHARDHNNDLNLALAYKLRSGCSGTGCAWKCRRTRGKPSVAD
jgi:hypothetical protein